MNVLDENVIDDQRQLLREWRIAFRQIGAEIERKGVQDDQILPLLRRLPQPTFFPRDLGLYRRQFCHARYCLAVLAVRETQVADYARRLLRHPALNTQRKRMGTVIRASATGLTLWRMHAEAEEDLSWPP